MQADLAHRILILTNNLDRFSACAYFRRLSRPWQLIPLAVANTIISLTKSMGRTYSYSWFGGANAHVPYIQVEPANFVRHASGHQLASGTITHANRRCAMMGDRQPLLFVRTTDGMRACWYITWRRTIPQQWNLKRREEAASVSPGARKAKWQGLSGAYPGGICDSASIDMH
jgi:hypothetical protein